MIIIRKTKFSNIEKIYSNFIDFPSNDENIEWGKQKFLTQNQILFYVGVNNI